jgi:NAD(P)-dependent dehydrogenase (short-subunit alcohol dehydrogenase family)
MGLPKVVVVTGGSAGVGRATALGAAVAAGALAALELTEASDA